MFASSPPCVDDLHFLLDMCTTMLSIIIGATFICVGEISHELLSSTDRAAKEQLALGANATNPYLSASITFHRDGYFICNALNFWLCIPLIAMMTFTSSSLSACRDEDIEAWWQRFQPIISVTTWLATVTFALPFLFMMPNAYFQVDSFFVTEDGFWFYQVRIAPWC